MIASARQRLFDAHQAFDHPLTLSVTMCLAATLLLAPMVIVGLSHGHRISRAMRTELMARWRSWVVLVPLLLVPTLLGAAWVIAGIGALSLLCYREYARATGLFRERFLSLIIVLGIILLTLASLDHWYRLFVAITPMTIAIIAAASLLPDQPIGYIQRTALGVLGFALFGTCLGHLGYFANDTNYRPMLILVVMAVQANDVFAFICGKLLGRRKLAPKTSPNKTIAGAIGAIVLTSLLVVGMGLLLPKRDIPDAQGINRTVQVGLLGLLGVMLSVAGQLGDLMMSAIKRDLGLKDMGRVIPGHGGLLDRFDSLILASPAAFHFANYFAGIGLDQPTRVFSGG